MNQRIINNCETFRKKLFELRKSKINVKYYLYFTYEFITYQMRLLLAILNCSN